MALLRKYQMDMQSLVLLTKIIQLEATYIYRRDINGVWLFSQKLEVSGDV